MLKYGGRKLGKKKTEEEKEKNYEQHQEQKYRANSSNCREKTRAKKNSYRTNVFLSLLCDRFARNRHFIVYTQPTCMHTLACMSYSIKSAQLDQGSKRMQQEACFFFLDNILYYYMGFHRSPETRNQ